MSNSTATAERLNGYGFPIVTCRRCGGTGSFGPKSIQGGTCFDCAGGGLVIKPGKAEAAWLEFVKARKEQRNAIASALQVGDRVQLVRKAPLRTIAGVEWIMLGRGCGYGTQGVEGSPRYIETHYVAIDIVVTFTDGGTRTFAPRELVTRAGVVDPAPFLAAAGLA